MRERVAGILVCDHRVALIRRNRGEEEYYLFPGGGVEPGETRSVALVRELREELGLEVEVGSLVAVVMRNGNWQGYYVVHSVGGKFGTGTGIEVTGGRPPGAGSYTPVWLSINDLTESPVRPRCVAKLVCQSLVSGWPELPEHFDD